MYTSQRVGYLLKKSSVAFYGSFIAWLRGKLNESINFVRILYFKYNHFMLYLNSVSEKI